MIMINFLLPIDYRSSRESGRLAIRGTKAKPLDKQKCSAKHPIVVEDN